MEINIKDKNGEDIVLSSSVNPDPKDELEENEKEFKYSESYEEESKKYDEYDEDPEEDEDIPQSLEECIETNYYVNDELRKKLREEAYSYNQVQIKRNFCFLVLVIGGLIEFVETVIVKTNNKTYSLILPIALGLAAILLIFYHIKKKKFDPKIIKDYNTEYQHLCLNKNKFHLNFKTEKVDKDKTVYHTKNENSNTKIIVKNSSEKPYTVIEFDEKLWSNRDFDIKSVNDYNGKEYNVKPIKDNDTDKIKGVKIDNYIYGSGFDTFYDRYNYNKITQYVIEENAIINTLYDFFEKEFKGTPIF